MFSTVVPRQADNAVETSTFVNMTCGVDSPMNLGQNERYPQSTGPTTTTTLLYL